MVMVDATSSVSLTYNVTELTKGSPDMSKYVLSFDGIPSDPIDVNAGNTGVSIV